MKIKLIASLIVVILLFTGASIWEGAAAIAVDGDLPLTGYYAATNSFPRNTVVDITNLENGKSIRVIVASGLETPGLLAVLSREAASFIGLHSRSVGRIRMIQSQDSAAFFNEGTDSGVESGNIPVSVPTPTPEPEPDTRSDALDQLLIAVPAEPAALAAMPAPNAVSVSAEPAAETAPAPVSAGGITPAPPETIQPGGNGYEMPVIAYMPEPEWKEDIYLESKKPEPPPVPEKVPEKTPVAVTPPPQVILDETYNYSLQPAVERPPVPLAPQAVYEIPPDKIISPIAEAARPAEAPAQDYVFIDPIPANPPQETLSRDYAFIAPIPAHITQEAEPVIPPAPAEPAPASSSIRMITGLERGKYYVQLGSYSKAELLEAEISRIGSGYPLVVQSGGTEERPVYRILLGPLNLGESGAVLQRFKSIGYKDAFVRSN